MKTFIFLISILCISSTWAIDGSIVNGEYGTESPKTCGFHAEGWQDEVILEARSNPANGLICGVSGKVLRFECSNNYCYAKDVIDGDCTTLKIEILRDGSFLFINDCQNPKSIQKFRKF